MASVEQHKGRADKEISEGRGQRGRAMRGKGVSVLGACDLRTKLTIHTCAAQLRFTIAVEASSFRCGLQGSRVQEIWKYSIVMHLFGCLEEQQQKQQQLAVAVVIMVRLQRCSDSNRAAQRTRHCNWKKVAWGDSILCITYISNCIVALYIYIYI